MSSHWRVVVAASSRRTKIVINLVLFVFIHLLIISSATSSSSSDATSDSRGADANDDKLNQQQQQHLASIEDGHVLLDSAMENTTCFEWDTIRIKCDITGYPLPRYKWYKDGNPLDSHKVQLHLSVSSSSGPTQRRFDIKTTPWGSRLRLANVTLRDAGVYTCEGFNQFGRQLTSGRLTVRQGSNPNRNSRQRQMMESEDDEEQFDEDANDDLSMLKWPAIDRRRVLPPDGAVQVDMGVGLPSLHANPSFSETTSRISGKFGGNRNVDEERGEDGGYDDEDDDESGSKDGTCQPYQGSTCSRFVDNRSIYSWRGRKQSQLEDQLIALLKTSTRLSTVCFDHLIPTLCYVAFPQCRTETTPVAGGGRLSDNRRGRGGPRRRPMSAARGRRPMCGEDCRLLDDFDCRTEYKAMAAAAAALAAAGSNRRQLQSFSELLQLSWCRLPSDAEVAHHQLDNDCAHILTDNIQRPSNNVTFIDSASPQLDHDYQLHRALTVLIPCAVVPLLIALLLVAVRRCRRTQDNNPPEQRTAGSSAPVKKDTIRVVSANGANALECKTEQWPHRGMPGLSHADFVFSWSPTHNENGARRLPPPVVQFADAPTAWNIHRVYTAAPPGQQHLGSATPSHNIQRHQIHHDQPAYPVRHQTVAPVHQPDMPSSTLLQHNYAYHPYHHHATRCSIRRPGTPASATTSGDGRSGTQKPSPTASLSTDLYGIGDQHHQPQYHPHLPVVTSCLGFDSGAWSASSGTQHQYGGGPIVGRRTPTGSDRSTGGFDRGCPA